MAELKVLGICGSLRKSSFNRRLLSLAAGIAEAAGARVEILGPEALNVPLYNADFEAAGLSGPVSDLVVKAVESDVFLIASPEYNYSIPAPLKNWVDWLSRVKPNPFSGKVAAIMGVSNGPMATVRMQPHLRQSLGSQNLYLIPQPIIMVPNGDFAFQPDGTLADPALSRLLAMLVERTLELARKLKHNA